MPAGVSWGEYLRFTSVALLSMLAGAQAVHIYYNPMRGLEELIEKEKLHLRVKYGSGKADEIGTSGKETSVGGEQKKEDREEENSCLKDRRKFGPHET